MTNKLATSDNFGILAILHALTFFTGFGLIGIIIYYIIQKDKLSNEELEATKNTINFHISFIIYLIVSSILIIIFIGFLGILVFGITYIIFGIIGFIKLINGEVYNFPWSIKLLK